MGEKLQVRPCRMKTNKQFLNYTDYRAVINLDSAGSGGREILFQTGPGHPWLMNYYRQVPYPFANSLAEEIFQGGMIPSDTDFHIFHQFGNIPGFDFAYTFNGYIYHTEYDGIKYVTKSSLQHTGDNLLKLAIQMSNAPEIYDTSVTISSTTSTST